MTAFLLGCLERTLDWQLPFLNSSVSYSLMSCDLIVDECLLAVNLGALTLQALFENWPSTHTQEETKTIEKGRYRLGVVRPSSSHLSHD